MIGCCRTCHLHFPFPSLTLVLNPSSSCANHWLFKWWSVHVALPDGVSTSIIHTWCEQFLNIPAFLFKATGRSSSPRAFQSVPSPPRWLQFLGRLRTCNAHMCESSRCCNRQTCCIVDSCGLASTWLSTQHVPYPPPSPPHTRADLEEFALSCFWVILFVFWKKFCTNCNLKVNISVHLWFWYW